MMASRARCTSGTRWISRTSLDRDGGLDGRVALVTLHLEVFKLIVKNTSRLAFDDKRWIGKWRATELQRHLLGVVAVDVAITAGPDEIAHLQIALLGHHVRQQGVAGD